MKKCNFCGNKDFVVKKNDYIYRHEGHFMLFKNVPYLLCLTVLLKPELDMRPLRRLVKRLLPLSGGVRLFNWMCPQSRNPEVSTWIPRGSGLGYSKIIQHGESRNRGLTGRAICRI